jgi:isopenicillin-N epimerase
VAGTKPYPFATTRRGFLRGTAASAPLLACARPDTPRTPGGAPDWAKVRSWFVYPADVGYLNTGTLGAMPRPVLDAYLGSIERLERDVARFDYITDAEPPLTGYAPLDDYRGRVAAFVGAHPDEIALTQNATMGMNFAAHGLDLQAGDEIVLTNQEHPGGIGPWQLQGLRQGVVVKQVDILPHRDDPDAIVAAFAAAIGERTRVVMACHMTSLLGLVLPVARLCELARSRGAVSVVDGAQTVGQIRVDVAALGCDIYVASPHKWLCAPKGTGFMVVRRRILPKMTATLGSAEFANESWGAARLQQYGTGSPAVLHGLRAAIDLQEQLDPAAIEARDRALTARLRAGLSQIPRARIHSSKHPEMHAAVTTFALEGIAPQRVMEEAWRAKLRIRSVHDELGCRVGTHYYVQESEVDRLLEVVDRLAKS